MSMHFGQIVRVYDSRRYTIWDLDNAGPAVPCYETLRGKGMPPEPGDIVEFRTDEGQGCATYVRLADPRDLTEAQIKNLIISSLGNGVEPIGHSQKAHSRK